MVIKSFVKKILGENLYKQLSVPYNKVVYRLIYPYRQSCLIKELRQKEVINVVFFASVLSMWRYQRIYELLKEHPRFNPSIVIVPFMSYSKEQQKIDVAMLKSYFDSLQIQYYVGGETVFNIRTDLSPDVLFYPQPYIPLYPQQYDILSFKDRLLCYLPYDFRTSTGKWAYNLPFHNFAWKLFYSTEFHRKEAQLFAYNKGRNVVVVGYPNADNYLLKDHKDVWKKQESNKKRIIWAPHYTIFSGGPLAQSNFLWMSDFMLKLTEQYSEQIQFVFKPHPRLITELYKHKDWGKDKAECYYKEWATRGNTQIETGDFIDLFMTSDAMIHDSASFSVEYHYTGNPVMYIADNFEQQVAEKGQLGQLTLRQHYVGKSKEDIISFIENVVIKGYDPMKDGRKEFYSRYLLPPNGKSVAENTMDVLLKEFC